MKLTVSGSGRQQGFALPTILLVSIVMLAVLVAAIGAAAGSRVALDSQYYNDLARQAAESGITRANECLGGSGYTPQWSTAASGAALTPATACTGSGTSYSAYIVNTSNLRTTFSVDAPSGSGIGSNLKVTGTAQLLRSTTNSDGTHDVWRQYDYVTYLRIEPPETTPCPDGFISVPKNPAFNITSDFCVMKYEAKNVNGTPASQASGTPYVNVTQDVAAAASKAVCNTCHLITEAEWLTIAQNILNVSSNWSGGQVGSGYVFVGHTDNSPSAPLAASTDDNGYYGTGNTGNNQRRTLRLSNGQVIWDFSGNVWEWTSGQTSGNQPGISGETSYSWKEWKNASAKGYAQTPGAPLWSPVPSYGTLAAGSWTFASNSIGQVYSNNGDTTLRGFIRGGEYNDPSGYGIFSLALSRAPSDANSDTGFRVAR